MMAHQPPTYPSNSSLNTPSSTLSQSSAPFTPHSTSSADDSDAEFDPTPLQSPRGGPDYDDLPPSYDEAQHQAVSDARNGVTPLDPSQIEAHRLTLNEGPDEPEIWEYRIRGEQVDEEEQHEQAPDYENFTNDLGTSVPVQHVQNTESIPVGQIGPRSSTSSVVPISIADLVDRALDFTHQQPDADIQYAPRLTKPIAIPQQKNPAELQEAGGSGPIQFLRAYAKALHAHCVQPAEFMVFMDGLNALCIASAATVGDVLTETETKSNTPGIVQDYIRGANEGFFAPRGLKVLVQSFSALVDVLGIAVKRGQRNDAIVSVLDHTTTAEQRAQALQSWAEALVTDVPASSTQSLMLLETAERLRQQASEGRTASATKATNPNPESEHEDPPHSVPDASTEHNATARDGRHGNRRRGRGRGGHHNGPWTPFGPPGHGPFGAPGNGPFGLPGNSPFGRPVGGPFGSRGRGRGHGPPSFGHHRGADRAGGSAQAANDWAALGQNIGKWGEEFGKRMGDWGQELGKQAEVWGQDVGSRATAWSGDMHAGDSGSGSRSGPDIASAQADDTLPPSYEDAPGNQESGVLRGDSKDTAGPPSYEHLPKGKYPAQVEKDGDSPSSSSDSWDSDSDSDSDSDDEDDHSPDTQAIFLKRLQSIDKQAEDSARKGKKSPEEIARERALAIEKAQDEKTAMDLKIEEKVSKRAIRREHKQKRRNLKREHRHRKWELKALHVGKGKGKGKAKKTPEWKQARKEYKEKKKELRQEKLKARKEARPTRPRGDRDAGVDYQQEGERMAWVVIQNLD